MKKFSAWLVLISFAATLVFTTATLAQEVGAAADAVVTNPEVIQPPTVADWQAFLSALGGAKGLGTLGVIGVVVQGLLLALRSQIGAYAGRYRLVAVALLTFVTGGVGLKLSGLDWASVLMHSSTLLAFQVLLNQVFKQFVVKSDEPAKL